jgi:hypothetical protein
MRFEGWLLDWPVCAPGCAVRDSLHQTASPQLVGMTLQKGCCTNLIMRILSSIVDIQQHHMDQPSGMIEFFR